MNTVQDTITCWLSIVTGSCGRVDSRKTHSYIHSPINAQWCHTEAFRDCSVLLTFWTMPPDNSWHVEEFKLIPHRSRKDMFHSREAQVAGARNWKAYLYICSNSHHKHARLLWFNTTNLTLIYHTMVLNPWRETALNVFFRRRPSSRQPIATVHAEA